MSGDFAINAWWCCNTQRLLCMRHVAYLLNTSGLAVQNSLYEEGTAASSKRKSEFGDNEVTSKLQMHTSQQTHRLWRSFVP